MFALNLGLGLWPGLFQLTMFMIYSVVRGPVYGAANPKDRNAPASGPHRA